MGSGNKGSRGNMSDIRAPQPAPVTPDPILETPEEITIDLPEIEEPETVAPLVLAIAEELTNEADPSTPKKAKLDPTTKVTTRTVEIKISMPAVPMPNLKPITEHRAYTAARAQAAKVPRKKLALTGIVLATALFMIGSNLLTDHNAKVTADPNTAKTSPDLVLGTPNYGVMLPKGKTLESFAGSTWVNSSARNPVFVYIDTIGTANINISQQPLPDDFKSDPASNIEKLAVGFKATEKVTAGDSVVYIGTSEEGVQQLVFYKNNLLILMTSKVKIPTNQWIEYINSLR